jgi:biopolymer transport protein ExbD
MIGAMKKDRFTCIHGDADLDLVPMIDCIFLLLLFFMLCGRISMDQRTEQVSVPPTKTAHKAEDPRGWERVIISVYGSSQSATPPRIPRNSLRINNRDYITTEGKDNYDGYKKLRQVLNEMYDRAEKVPDPKGTGMKLPKVILEIRADSDTEYRVVQEIQQIATDTIDPFNDMKPTTRLALDPTLGKPFVHLNFTTRSPTDR